MGEFSIFHWLIVLAIIVLLFFGRKTLLDFGGPRSRPTTHPVPVTGPVETSRRPNSPGELLEAGRGCQCIAETHSNCARQNTKAYSNSALFPMNDTDWLTVRIRQSRGEPIFHADL